MDDIGKIIINNDVLVLYGDENMPCSLIYDEQEKILIIRKDIT